MSNSRHGGVRGANLARESRLFEGRFGRMFRSLPALDIDPGREDVQDLVARMTVPLSGDDGPERVMARPEKNGPTDENAPDGEEGLIPAGYTYLGQFIDHDLTFDPASSMERLNDPEALVDFRTPRFDLDCLYGRGPDDQPYMYDTSGRKFLLGDLIGGPGGHNDPGAVDHLRAPPNDNGNRRALIGDKRNDENTIVAQLHTVFLRFHNRLADAYPDLSFAEIQQAVRWHYQWIVLHDYLRRIVGIGMVHSILPHLKKKTTIFETSPNLRHYDWRNDPFMPTEFSAVAFRFGHSMVRPVYRLSRNFETLSPRPEPILDGGAKRSGRRMLFDFKQLKGKETSLNGFAPIPKGWAIEWDLFFGEVDPQAFGPNRVQPAYKVDTSLVNPLASLPEFNGSGRNSNLGYRNILRGLAMRLPSGETVARAMGERPLPPDWLVINKAEGTEDYKAGEAIASFKLGGKAPFAGATPLWLYILAEGARNACQNADHALGPVGGRIVAETMIGMMLGDGHSFLSLDPNWTPWIGDPAKFDILALITFAQGR